MIATGMTLFCQLTFHLHRLCINRVHEEILTLSDVFQIPRKQIQFELTQPICAEFSQGLETLLDTITKAGYKLAIDDFATRYTSLQQLVEYPASTIKFDKSFLDATMQRVSEKYLNH